jgi:hypothetical protein
MEGIESQLSLYFTTSAGPYKLDSLTGTPLAAGVPPGLDVQVELSASATGWMAADTMVGYRVVFGRTDANTQETLGEPSPRVTLSNPLGGSASNVTVTFTIPAGLSVTTNSFYEIYRTDTLESVSTLPAEFKDPGDRQRLVIRNLLTSGDITTGYVTYSDTTDALNLGADLYTNPLQETDQKENSRPPYCEHLALWKGHVWYANTREYHVKEIWLKTVVGLTDNTDYIRLTIGDTSITYTFSTAESTALRRFKRWTSEATDQANVQKTMESFCKILNRDTLQTTYWAQYVSGIDDNAGRVEIRRRDFTDTAFTITSTSGGSGKFSPILPTSGTTYASSSTPRKNGLYHSKFEQPESVPWSNYDTMGSADYAILALIPLKDALVVCKEDGYYSVTGSSDGSSGSSFTISLLDPTLRLLAPSSAVTLDNAVYAFTSQGVVRSTESGSKIMSWPIERDLQQIAQMTEFSTVTTAVAYESDRKYLLCTQTVGNSTPKTIWVFNYVTEAWTRWTLPISSGIVLEQSSGGDKLYLAHQDDPYILEERKSFSTCDEDFTDWSVSGLTMGANTTIAGVKYYYLTSAEIEPHEGWMVASSTEKGVIQTITTSYGDYMFSLDRDTDIARYTPITLYYPIEMRVEWMPEYAGNAASMKQFNEGQIYFESEGGTHVMGFCADTQATPGYTDDIVFDKTFGWGRAPWGATPWGDGSVSPAAPVRSWIPRDHQRCRGLRLIYTNCQAEERVAILQVAYGLRDYGSRTQANPR